MLTVTSAVSLNLNSHRVGADQTPAARDVFEKSKEDLDRPAAILVDQGNPIRRGIRHAAVNQSHKSAGIP